MSTYKNVGFGTNANTSTGVGTSLFWTASFYSGTEKSESGEMK